MGAPPQHSTRPYTPPDSEPHGSPESAYFSDPFRRSSSGAFAMDHRPPPVHAVTEPAPYTPTKTSSLLQHHTPGALRYPYTPESSRALRPGTAGSLSPTPWDTDSHYSASPVQSALSSCIAHFENLTSTRELTDDQMEYIVGQFENMTSFLAAPDAQTKRDTEDLFSGADSPRLDSRVDTAAAEPESSYAAEVGRYIEGVQKYTADLKKRFDEARALNKTALAIIDDLRKKSHTVSQDSQEPLDLNPQNQEIAGNAVRDTQESLHLNPPNHETASSLAQKSIATSFASMATSLASINNLQRPPTVSQNMQDLLDLSAQNQERSNSQGQKDIESSWASIATIVADSEDTDAIKPQMSKPTTSMVDSSTQTDDCRRLIVTRKPVQPEPRGFWTALSEALDIFGDDLHER